MSWAVSGHVSEPPADHDERVKAFFAKVTELALETQITDPHTLHFSPSHLAPAEASAPAMTADGEGS